LDSFNDLPADRAVRELLCCCASPEWAAAMAGPRPYHDLKSVTATADEALARLGWGQVALALAALPRIGQPFVGTGRRAVWSRREQYDTRAADSATLDQLTAAHHAYERRFGWILPMLSGRTAAESLILALVRLGNDDLTERDTVRDELACIVRSRLERLLG
jgi:2-oxo-4-hydroxy-4-carboxy-5-ureidoimidazoline decarboxylase